jgi:FAD:protein FMN transferase
MSSLAGKRTARAWAPERSGMSPETDAGPQAGTSTIVADPVHQFEHHAMNCGWGIYLVGEDERYAAQAAHAAFAEVDRIERELSRFIPTSDIARINALSAGQSVRIGPDAFACLETAAQVCAATHGAFDITIGSLLGPGPHRPLAPHMPRIGVDEEDHSVTALSESVVLDLGGIGKGFAIDQAVAVLRNWKITAALIHSGTSTAFALGAPAGEPGWPVAVRDPFDRNSSLARFYLRDMAFSGSSMVVKGAHIVDPQTGEPPSTGALGAWAIATTGAQADALSTAFMILSPNEVANYCRRHPHTTGMLYLERPEGLRLQTFGREPQWALPV